MPLPLPNLDDRRFDDLVAEAIARVESHTPEWSNIAPGDPGAALIDMFAWLTETILYRQNLIPLRQRRAFMNLLALPLRPASPARGVVCVDAPGLPLPAVLAAGQARFTAGQVSFTSTGDLQPTPLGLTALMKIRHQEADPVAQARLTGLLRTLYNIDRPAPFIARTAFGADGTLALGEAIDGLAWLALTLPKGFAASADAVRTALAGSRLSIGLAPVDDVPGPLAFDQATALPPRTLSWALVTTDASGVRSIPLAVQADTSLGGRQLGTVLLGLPSTTGLMTPPPVADPMFAGTGGTPPELPVDITADRVVLWITLGAADAASVRLAWLGVNAVDITARAIERDQPLGIATGQGDLAFALRGAPVDPASLVVQVWQGSRAATWAAVENFGGAGPNDSVYVLDATAGTVTFGDGVRGLRPPAGAVIVATKYAWGGGANGNLATGSIKAVAPAIGAVRHEWPTGGGLDGEGVEDAERRIPAFLSTRDRAVTIEDFRVLALATPGVALGRAEVVPGLLPGADPDATRTAVPGVVSVFVFPAAAPGPGGGPVATLGVLRDVFASLRERVLIGTQLFVLAAVPVPVAVSVGVELVQGADPAAIGQAVQGAIIGYLWPVAPGGPSADGWPLGRSVAADELVTQAARVAGVLAVTGLALLGNGPAGWTASASIALKPWEVLSLTAVGVATDGSVPSGPPAGLDRGIADPGQFVPYVPPVC